MENVLCQNSRDVNCLQSTEIEISASQTEVVQSGLPKAMKKPYGVPCRKIQEKVQQIYRCFGDTQINNALPFEEYGYGKQVWFLGNTHLDRKAFVEQNCNMCALLTQHKQIQFLNRNITRNEKLISYNNMKQKAGKYQVNPLKL